MHKINTDDYYRYNCFPSDKQITRTAVGSQGTIHRSCYNIIIIIIYYTKYS